MRARGDVYQYGPQILTAEGCESLCAQVRECNAWRFCAGGDTSGARVGSGKGGKSSNGGVLPLGCGSGCQAFARGASAFPRAALVYTLEVGRDCGPWPDSVCTRVGARLSSPVAGRAAAAAAQNTPPPPHLPPQPVPPFNAVGPYLGMYGSPCQHACANGTVPPDDAYGYAGLCKKKTKKAGASGSGRGAPAGPEVIFSDRWLAGTCTLLHVRDPSAPVLDRRASPKAPGADGWIGGTIERPARCANVSAEACERCVAAAGAAALGGERQQRQQQRPRAAAAAGFSVSAVQAGGEAACLACAARRTMPAWDVITGHDGVRVECQAPEEQQQQQQQQQQRLRQGGDGDKAAPFQVRSSCGAESGAGLDCTVSREAAGRRCAGLVPEDAAKFNEGLCRFVGPTSDGAARPLME
jgi:hypothetical protein